jgi:predicted MFS family arabinose efflux permease
MASAPVLGGYLQHLFNWRGCFGFLALYGVLLMIVVTWQLPETLDNQHSHQLSWPQLTRNLKELLSSRQFLGCCSILFAIYGGMLSWLVVGPVYFQHVRHLSPTTFGWIAFIVGGSSALGAFINTRLINYFNPSIVLKGALSFMFCCSVTFLLMELTHQVTIVWIIILLAGYVGPTILVFANILTKALSPFGHIAGIGFAMIGFVQIIGGSSISALLSLFSTNNLVPLAICFVLTSMASLGVAILID